MKKSTIVACLLLLALASFAQVPIENYRFYIDESRNLIVCNQLPAAAQLTVTPVKLQMGNVVVTFANDVTSLEKGKKYVVSGNSKSYNLYFTELPLINLQVPDPSLINRDEEIPGALSLSESTGNPYNSNMAIRIRGNSSSFFPKKSYRVQLKDAAGKNKDESLLGLRSDKRWLLLAMWNEELRANNAVSHELWIDMHKLYYAASEPKAISSIRTKYVEVFLNNSYLGVYAFAEDMDRKQLALKKEEGGVTRGELYKADDWSLSSSFAGIGVPKANPGDDVWQSWELEYPDQTDWVNHYNFLKAVIESSDDQFKSTIGSLMKIDNVIDYFIFMNMLIAEDNMEKNWFLARYDQGEPYFFVPWDLDGTWSYKPDGMRTNLTQGERTSNLFNRLMRLNPDDYKNRLATRWFELRKTILTEAGLKNRFSEKYNYLNNNLVYEREVMATSDHYGGANRSFGLSYVHNYITQRLVWLDSYFCPMLTSGNCGGPQPATCNFAVTASPSNAAPACAAAITLNAECTGGDCNAVTYQWSGNGINQSGKSVSVNAPGTNGTFSYTVTASKNGCTAKTASVTVTVSSCQTTEPGPGTGEPFSACVEAENASGNGPITEDPNASGGRTRGDKNNYNHYVDYAVNGVKATGTHQLKLRYYAGGNAQVSISVNGSVVNPSVNLPATYSWNIVWREETINVPLNQGNNTVRIQGLPGFSVRQDRICVTGSGGSGNPVSCNFDISPSTATPVATPGQAVTLNANCSGGDCGGASFAWTGQGANATGASVSITPPATPGDYTYTLTASKTSCTSKTATVTVRVQNAAPVCDFTVAAYPSNATPACSEQFRLVADCTGPSCGEVTYQWSGNGVNSTSAAAQVNAPAANGTYNYTLTASKAGCAAKSYTATITVSNCNPGPGTSEPFSQCLEAENMAGTGPVTDDPNASNGKTRGDRNNWNHEVDYVVTGVKAGGRYKLTLRYYAAGNATASISVNGAMTAPVVGFPATYSWNIVWAEYTTEVTLNEGENRIRIAGLPGNSLRQDRLCVTNTGNPGNPVSCKFNVSPAASPAVATPGQAIILNANCSGDDCGSIAYTWTGPGTAGNTASISTTAPATPGDYTYQLAAVKTGCATISKTATVKVQSTSPGTGGPFSACIESENADGNGPITEDPNASNGRTRGDKNNYNHYVDYAVNGVPAAGTYQLKLRYYASSNANVRIAVNNATAIASAMLPATYSWNIVWREETFNVTLAAGNNVIRIQGLPGASCRQDKLCVSGGGQSARMAAPEFAQSHSDAHALQAFPNPAPGAFKAVFYLQPGEMGTIRVTDVQGKVWHTQQVKGRGEHEERIQIDHAPTGIYMLQIKKATSAETKKILLTR